MHFGAIHRQPHGKVLRIGNFIAGDQPRPKLAEVVAAFAFGPLARTFLLEGALGHIIGYGIACNMFQRIRFGYIFGFRASKGSKPIYAGKATKLFKQEVFTDHKLKKYSLGFASQAKGTPILFFICLNKTAGPVNKSAIDEAESYLIQAGLAANKKLLNDRKTSVESWSIGGIVRSKGKASASSLALRKCIKL